MRIVKMALFAVDFIIPKGASESKYVTMGRRVLILLLMLVATRSVNLTKDNIELQREIEQLKYEISEVNLLCLTKVIGKDNKITPLTVQEQLILKESEE